MLRIGVLTTSYPRRSGDYAGAFVAELCAWLSRRGHRLDVIAPFPAAESNPEIAMTSIRYARVPQLFYRNGAPENLFSRREPRWKRSLMLAQAASFMARLVYVVNRRSHAWDVMLSHWLLPCGAIGSWARPDLPHVAVAHSSEVHLLAKLPRFITHDILEKTLHRNVALVCTSAFLREKLRSLCLPHSRAHEKIQSATILRMGFVPPHALSTMSSTPRQNKNNQNPNDHNNTMKTAIVLGRLVPVKGISFLLHALQHVENLSLTIVGDGPLRRELERLALQLGLSARVTFCGTQVGDAKWNYLMEADIAVFPLITTDDGWVDSVPVSLLEAMACGLPVIASDVGGVSEILIHEQNGLLVPSRDVMALVSALRRLVSDGALRRTLGTEAMRRVQKWSWDQLGPQFERLCYLQSASVVR